MLRHALAFCALFCQTAAFSETVSLNLLSFNVKGLPDVTAPLGIRPFKDRPPAQVSIANRMSSNYDIILFQESFHYFQTYERQLQYPFLSGPAPSPYPTHTNEEIVAAFFEGSGDRVLNDGLARAALQPFSNPFHESWRECNGYRFAANDCMSHKGFSRADHFVAGETLTVYNVHFDAGKGRADQAIRQTQVTQILDDISRLPPENAVIIGGDFNMTFKEAAIRRFGLEASFSDACKAVQCAIDGGIDRFLYRHSNRLWISIDSVSHDRTLSGLSDHEAVHLRIRAHSRPR